MKPTGLLAIGRAEQILERMAGGRLDPPRGPVTFVYLDPPFRPWEMLAEPPSAAARASWCRMLEGCLSSLGRLMRGKGTVCLHVDRAGAGYGRRLLGGRGGVRTIEWQRDPQAGEHDLLLICGRRTNRFLEGFWCAADWGSVHDARAEMVELFPGRSPFPHPKPERLLHGLIAGATDPGDVVVDPFLGSGTAAAVAHRCGRSWIGIEADRRTVLTYAEPRLRGVVAARGGTFRVVGIDG